MAKATAPAPVGAEDLGIPTVPDPTSARDASAALDALPDLPDAAAVAPAGADVPEATAPEPPRRGPGRPRKALSARRSKRELVDAARDLARENDALRAQLAATAPEAVDATRALAGTLGTTFDSLATLAAKRWGGHWALDGEEAAKLGEAWAPVVAPWIQAAGVESPLAGAVLLTAALLVPRVVVTVQTTEATSDAPRDPAA